MKIQSICILLFSFFCTGCNNINVDITRQLADITNQCEYISPFSDGVASVQIDGKVGFIDKQGKIVIPNVYEESNSIRWFKEGMVVVSRKVKPNKSMANNSSLFSTYSDKYGFVDKYGKQIIPFIYESAEGFSEGLAAVLLNGKWGFVDEKGHQPIPCIYDFVGDFSEGMASVEKDGKIGFVDRSGKIVIPLIYDGNTRTTDFSNGLARIGQKVGEYIFPIIKYGYINMKGDIEIPFIYDFVGGFNGDLSFVELNGKYGFINKSGEVVIPTIYDSACDFSGGLAEVSLNGKFGFINEYGKIAIPILYDSADSFSEGLASVELNGKWGYVDKDGTLVIPTIYDDASRFREGLAVVELNGKQGYIDKQGNSTFNF